MSKIALAVLGLAMESPKHGYEIIQDIKEREMDHWVQLSTASIYNTLNKLEKEHYISETKIKIGNTPERKVYKVNPKGEKYLSKLVEENIERWTYLGHHFRLAVAFIEHMDPLKAAKAIRKRKERLVEHRNQLMDDYKEYDNRIPFNWLLLLQSGIDHIAAEIRMSENLVRHLENEANHTGESGTRE